MCVTFFIQFCGGTCSMPCLSNSVCVYVDLSATDIYKEIKRLSHMQQLTDIRMETSEILRRFETTSNRIENLAFLQKEQSHEIKGRVESIEKSHALTKQFIAKASTREQIDEMKTEVAAVAREQASIKSEICSISRHQSHLQRKQDQIASKQDLLHSTITNEQCTTSSVMLSPLLSPVASGITQFVQAFQRFSQSLGVRVTFQCFMCNLLREIFSHQ